MKKKKKLNVLHADIYTQSDEGTINSLFEGCMSLQKHAEPIRQVRSPLRLNGKKFECS